MKYLRQIITAALFVTSGAFIQAAETFDISSNKQLILDGPFLADSQGVSLKIRPPRKTGDVVLRPEHEWESTSLNWFNVVQDQGRIVVDSLSTTVPWKTGSDVRGRAAKPARLRVEMPQAQLFGFHFTSDNPESTSQ